MFEIQTPKKRRHSRKGGKSCKSQLSRASESPVPGGSCVPMLPTPKKANIETNILEQHRN